MNFSFHNQLTIQIQNKKYIFFNKLLPSTLIQLSNFKKFNEYISIGNGLPNEEIQNSYHLTQPITTIKLENKSFQSDISKGSVFAKYEFRFSDSKTITEIGLSNNEENPIIFNYFSLITNETPNGITLESRDEVLFEISIFLTINESKEFLLTSGQNPFLEFLLGNGLGDVFIAHGSNYTDNIRMCRELNNAELFICEKNSNLENNILELSFEKDLNKGELDEILFVTNDKVFARMNLKTINQTSSESITLSSKQNYIIKIDSDIKSINSIKNLTTQENESNYFVSKFANSFGDKIHLPFSNLFNSTSSRFLSKCGKNIFFVLNEKVYGYSNENFQITPINTKDINDFNIQQIISFDNFVFVITKHKPYISCYTITNNTLEKQKSDFYNLTYIEELEDSQQIDITRCNNGNFILGVIKKDKTALSIYFKFDQEIGFSCLEKKTNAKEFNYLLAMYKNNFCDGQIIYLKEGSSSVECRIVTHDANISETDIYSSLAYHLTNNATKIYCKNRAIISEKTNEPSVVIYYYPQIFEYNLPLISNEKKDYISNNLNYLIQEFDDKEFKIYNLVGYNEPEEFSNSISNLVQTKDILDFEFMNDSLLIFLNNDKEPVVAFNLKLNKTQIENLSKSNSSYLINLDKYNKLGKDNKIVNFNFLTRINLWFFLIKFIK